MGKVLVINYDICNGCYNCQVACKDEHVANDWSPIAKPQPDTGQFWNKVYDNVRGQVPKVKITYEHSICQHCDDAPCIPACNANAIYKRDDGIVIIDPDKCRGNQMCMPACPYENVIYFNDTSQHRPEVHVLRAPPGRRLDRAALRGRLPDRRLHLRRRRRSRDQGPHRQGRAAQAGTRHVKPRVYYIGLPKKFIAGAVYDKEADECLGGVKVTATNDATGAKLDGHHRQLRRLLAQGPQRRHVHPADREVRATWPQKVGPVDVTKKDINVGDIAIWKA